MEKGYLEGEHCNWDSEQEYLEKHYPQIPFILKDIAKQRQDEIDKINEFIRKGENPEKIMYYTEPNSHSSYFKIGVYPKGMSGEELLKGIGGGRPGVGGMFKAIDNISFCYICYTD